MGLGEYPTVTATLVALRDPGQKGHVLQLLKTHYSMSEEDAQQALGSLPFRLPVSFFTLKEGQNAVRELVGLGCEIKLRDMMDPEPEEEEEPAPAPAPVVESRVPRPEISHRPAPPPPGLTEQKEKGGKGVDQRYLLIGGGVLLVAAGALLLSGLFSGASDEKEISASEKVERVEQGEDSIFRTPFLRDLAASIDAKLNKMQTMDQFLKRLSKRLDQNRVSREDRHALSDHYTRKAQKPRPKESNHIRTMRSLKMLEVALTINNKNRTAWTQMVEFYQRSGMSHRARKTQLDMMEQLGRSTMVDIYGEEAVAELAQ